MRTLLSRVRGLFLRQALETRLDEEIRVHLDELTAEYERGGATPEQARLAARRAFGGVEPMKETHRDRRSLPWVETVKQDVWYAGRQMRRRPGMVLVAVLTLASSMAAAIAVFTIVNGVLWRPLTYPDADRLVVAHSRLPQFGRIPVSDAQYRVWRDSLNSIDGIALLWATSFNLSGMGEPERVPAARVSPGLFALLGVRPQLGRLLREDEDQPGRDRVVLVSDGLWRRRFGGDRTIVGKTIALNGHAHEIVGVLTADFRFPRISQLYSIPLDADRPEMWKPLALTPNDPITGLNFAAIARLRRGTTLPQAQSELAGLQRTLTPPAGPGGGNAMIAGEFTPLRDHITADSRRGLEVLLAAVGVILFIACLNVTSLILSRSAARSRELAIRSAVGATRRRLARQLFTEGFVLALTSGGAAVAIAGVTLRLLVLAAPRDIPRLDEVGIDDGGLLFAAFTTLATALILGLLPAWRLPRLSLQEVLKQSATRASGDGARARVTQSVLVAGQVGATAVCAIVAGLLFESFVRVLTVEKGFETANVVTGDLALAGPQYVGRLLPFQRALIDRLETLPGVRAVGLSSQQLLSGTGINLRILPEGTTVPVLERPLVNLRTVNAGFFRAFGIALRDGRFFSDTETRPVAVVSASLAAQLWPGQSAVGKRFRRGPDNSPPIEVVGVAADVRAARLELPAGPIVYAPYFQASAVESAFQAGTTVSLAVQIGTDTTTVISGFRRIVRELDPALPIAGLRTMDAVVAESVSERRFLALLVFFFSVIGVTLAGVGVYGVISQAAAQRMSEIGIRIALGAQRSEVVRMMLNKAWRLAALGLAVAVPVALLSGSSLSVLLFDVTPYNAVTIGVVCVAMIAIATVAAYAPARRASRIDAIRALRAD
jgi:putative ABC transport system permease protein